MSEKKCTHCTRTIFRLNSLINELKRMCKRLAHGVYKVHTHVTE